ncbi:MAG: DNA repair protein [Flavobacteriaceae bacterium]|nr:MAG: DNA repair protein [Flavobacteriaceae bacterium]
MKNPQFTDQFPIGEVQLSYKRKNQFTIYKITSSQSANECIRKIFPIEQISYRERMYTLYLDNSNNILGYQLLSIGGITGTLVDVRVLMQGALLTNAVGLLLFHNHPSNTLKPSNADKNITDKIIRSAEILDLKVLDHLIITEDRYYSFADNGEL